MARLLALAAATTFPRSGSCAGVKPLSDVDPADIFSVVKQRSEEASPGQAISGSKGPLPTNAWWENIAMAGDPSLPESSGNIFQMPYVIMVSNEGLHAMQPFTTGVTTQGFDKVEALCLGAAEKPEGPRIASWDELTVTLNWPMADPERGVTVPLARGSPYITAEYAGVKPQVRTEQQLRPDDQGQFRVRVDGEPVDCGGGPISGKVIHAELVQSDATWAIFSPPGVQWTCSPEPFSLTAVDPLEKGAVRVAIANSCTTGVREHHCQGTPDGRDVSAYANLLEAHAGAYPVSSSIDWEVDENDGHVTWNWESRQLSGHDKEPLLQLAYPVHQPLLSQKAKDSVQGEARSSPFSDLRGKSEPVVGNSWVLTYPLFPDVGLDAPRPIAPGLKAEMLKALRGPGGSLGALWNGSMPDCDFDLPLNYRLGVGDTYFSGKMLARLARLVVIADELGESKEGYFSDLVERLTERLEVWLHRDAEAPFIYDSTWGGLLSCGCMYDDCEGKCNPHCSNKKEPADACPALKAAGMNFGNGYYNDHHFHYGYFVYSAAVAAKYAPKWEKEWRDQIVSIVRDYANPSAEDPSFPVARHKDWFLGISWAGGIPQAYENGRNQESTSEAIHSYYAVYAYGSTVKAPFASGLKDFGRILTAMESHGADTYWHVRKNTGIYGEDFPDQVIGILWDHVVEHQTWFGGAPYIVSGIQLLPIVPVMENYLDPDWVKGDSATYKKECQGDPECHKGWSWPMCLEQAVLDPAAAYMCVYTLPKNAFDTNNAAANGNSLTNSLHWIATRPEAADLVFGDGDDSFEESPAEDSNKSPPKKSSKSLRKQKKATTRTSITSETTVTDTTKTIFSVTTTTLPAATTKSAAAAATVVDLLAEAVSDVTEQPSTQKATAATTTTGAPSTTTTKLTTVATTAAPSTTSTAAAAKAAAEEKAPEKKDAAGPSKKGSGGMIDASDADGPIQSGDTIFLRAHTGSYVDVQGNKVRARWNMQGDWQRIIIEKDGGGTIWSEDTVFLKTHTGRHLDVDGDTVKARWEHQGLWQELVIEKEDNDGAIWPGDTVFLTGHTGKCLDVQGSEVKARWPMHGPWEAFTIQKAAVQTKPVIVASEDSGSAASQDAVKGKKDDSDTTSSKGDPLMQWEQMGVVAMAQSQGLRDEQKEASKLTAKQKSSILDTLKMGAMKRFEEHSGDAALARPARVRAADAGRLFAMVGLASAAALAVLLLARRRVQQSQSGLTAGAMRYEMASASDGSLRHSSSDLLEFSRGE